MGMADFLVLPPKAVLGEHVARMLRPLLPGVVIGPNDSIRVLELLAAYNPHETVLVHRDELPEGEDLDSALRDGFGAGPQDRIVPVHLASLEATDVIRAAPSASEIPTM
jgi:hypothetical protein